MTKRFELKNEFPLIAILRGVETEQVVVLTQVLLDEGFTMIEVPLNSPNALASIRLLVEHFGDAYFIGAGTVTTLEQAEAVIATGANLVVTPNFNEAVVRASVAAGCATFPGIVTPSEAFAAVAAGATGLKLFPISQIGMGGFKALKSVLPLGTLCFPVGGINPSVESMKPYLDVGADGFGLGASLYKAGMSEDSIREKAKGFVSAFKACR